MATNLLESENFNNLGLMDWPSITEKIAQSAHFEKSKEILSSAFLPKSAQEINFAYDSLDFLLYDLKAISDRLSVYLYPIPPEKHLLEMIYGIKKGKVANFSELNFICLLIEAYKGLKKDLSNWNKFPRDKISPDKERILFREFVGEFRTFVEPNGEINYERHPVLSKIYIQIKKIELSLREEIQNVARIPLFSDALQYTEHDVINDRFVLAIRTDSYNKNHGPIVAKSNSGMTLFVEPPSLVELGNKRIQLMAELEEALNKICIEFSFLLQECSNEIAIIEEFLSELDICFAKARFCEGLDLVRPILTNKFEIKLKDFFHPLIKNPVKNDVDLFDEKKGIIISGPNTGGKTVTLKALATCHLFLHFGIFLPISYGEIFPVKHIFFFSNDQQSLAEGLSSFSSEVKNYINLIKNLSTDEENLILIDEIFNSTSSEEGSALAISLLEEIHKKSKSKIIISTHHQLLKIHFHTEGSYLSAHVGFDDQKEIPTFKIHYGSPGSSMAFSIFEKLGEKFGLKNELTKRAKELLRGENFSYEKLLQNLSDQKSKVDRILLENQRINKELSTKQKTMEGAFKLEMEKVRLDYEIKLKKTLDKAFKILESTKRGDIKGIKTLSNISAELKQEVRKEKSQDEERAYPSPTFDSIKVGETYYSYILKEKARVEKINPRKKEIFISTKNLSLWCSIDSLGITDQKKQAEALKVQMNVDRSTNPQTDLDCRGMRLEEFEKLVTNALLDLSNGDIPYLNIIHGHGEGVLKSWLRNYLKDKEDFKWGPDKGNDGITRIEPN
jgi:DNA mismatch repair protein MutS2